MVGRGRHRCGGCTGEIPLFRSFYRDGAEWSGLEDSFPFFFVPRRRTPLATSKSNSIPFSREREDHFRGGRGASLPLSADCPQDLVSGDSEGGAPVLIFRVVAQATCSKLKSTIDAASEVNLRAISVTDPPSRRGTLASLPRVGLDSNGLVDPPHFSSPRE